MGAVVRFRRSRRFALLLAIVILVSSVVGFVGFDQLQPPPSSASSAMAPASQATFAKFQLCPRGQRGGDCVIDGDTIRYNGETIRLADINAPETSSPQCPAEAALGQRATLRLIELLNAGPITVAPNNDGSGRDADQFGRKLRVIERDGWSLGAVLVSEGLAETWSGRRRNWCLQLGRPS